MTTRDFIAGKNDNSTCPYTLPISSVQLPAINPQAIRLKRMRYYPFTVVEVECSIMALLLRGLPSIVDYRLCTKDPMMMNAENSHYSTGLSCTVQYCMLDRLEKNNFSALFTYCPQLNHQTIRLSSFKNNASNLVRTWRWLRTLDQTLNWTHLNC